MEKNKFAFFIDFDKTIATIDVCEDLVKSFSKPGWQELNEKWEKKELSTVECAKQTFKMFKTSDPKDFLNFADKAELDPDFSEFAAYCEKEEYPIVILSDGYDYYIEHLLKREGLELTYYANKLIFEPALDIDALFSSQNCDSCGVCKLELMRKLSEPSCTTIYIGDGSSDFCPALSADIVFAKSALYEYCLANGKKARYFTGFSDILNKIQRMTGRRV